jgi:hypothetical protein
VTFWPLFGERVLFIGTPSVTLALWSDRGFSPQCFGLGFSEGIGAKTRRRRHTDTQAIQPTRRRDSAQEGFIIIQHSAFSIQHSAFSAGGIHHPSAFSAGGLHHSAQEASSFSDEDRVRWQYNPRTTAKDHQGKCVRWQYNPGGIHHHSAFSAGGIQRRTWRSRHAYRAALPARRSRRTCRGTARPRLLDLQLRQPSLRVMRPWGPCGPV